MMARDNLYAELMEDLHPNRPRVEILGDSRGDRGEPLRYTGIRRQHPARQVPRVRGAHSGCGFGADGAFHGRTGGDGRDFVGGVHHDRVRKGGARMIGRLWLLACGQVRVRVTGASLTRFSQPVRGAGYHARQMDRTAWNELHATLSIRDFRTLRRLHGPHGLPRAYSPKTRSAVPAARLRPRTALWSGAIAAAALCWLLGTHVWAIQTEIAPAIDETAVMQQR